MHERRQHEPELHPSRPKEEKGIHFFSGLVGYNEKIIINLVFGDKFLNTQLKWSNQNNPQFYQIQKKKNEALVN